jgi:hypothetical protein
MAINLEERPKSTCPFGVFPISLGSTLCTESELKSDLTVGNAPSLALEFYSISLTLMKSDLDRTIYNNNIGITLTN